MTSPAYSADVPPSPLEVLVIDDNRDDRELAARALLRELPHARVREINDAAGLAAALDAGGFEVVITDYQLRWTDGLTVHRAIVARYPDVPVIMFTNTGTEEVCAEALRGGLFDYIIKKPSQYARLPLAVRAALEAVATRRRLAAALEQERAARAEAERANRLKDEFLATVSHELRTPLNAILGYAGVLAGEPSLPDDVRQGLEVIERNARAQARLVDDLLDVSAITSGALRLDLGRVGVGMVASAVVRAAGPQAEAKGVELRLTGAEGAGLDVRADAPRLHQVLNNLVWNAIKFTPRGGRVDVAVARVGESVGVTVADTGEGIRAEFLPHVFERFRQQDGSTTRRHGGLGIGLSIVKHVVEMHGGSVRADSPGVGRGATFRISLPAVAANPRGGAAPAEAAVVPADDEPDLLGVRVLAVDDDPDARELVRRVLGTRRADVRTAASATEAVDAVARQGPPDVLVLDIGMPDEDGYALLGRLRRCGAAGVPAVALSAYARSEERRRSLLAGFLIHLAKPVEPRELIAVVASMTGRTGNA